MDKSSQYFDNLDNIFNGDKVLIFTACQSFIKHSQKYMWLITEAQKQKNGDDLKRIAHSFKYSFLMFGENDGHEAASELERIAIEDNWENSAEKIEKFSNILKYTVDTLQHITNSRV